MIEQTARRRNDNRNAASEALGFVLWTRAAHNEAVRELRMLLEKLADDAVRLHTQLARRRNDDDAGAVLLLPVGLEETLDYRHEEGERFSAARLCCADHIFALQTNASCKSSKAKKGGEKPQEAARWRSLGFRSSA